MTVEVGSVVAWEVDGGWAFGSIVAADEVRAVVKVIAGAPSNTARRPVSTLTPVLTSTQWVAGLQEALRAALVALDGARAGSAGKGAA